METLASHPAGSRKTWQVAWWAAMIVRATQKSVIVTDINNRE
jgi:hypothetical protein